MSHSESKPCICPTHAVPVMVDNQKTIPYYILPDETKAIYQTNKKNEELNQIEIEQLDVEYVLKTIQRLIKYNIKRSSINFFIKETALKKLNEHIKRQYPEIVVNLKSGSNNEKQIGYCVIEILEIVY